MNSPIPLNSIVEVVELSLCVPDAEVGDLGMVIKIYGSPSDPDAYEVRSCPNSGAVLWQGTLSPHQISLPRQKTTNNDRP